MSISSCLLPGRYSAPRFDSSRLQSANEGGKEASQLLGGIRLFYDVFLTAIAAVQSTVAVPSEPPVIVEPVVAQAVAAPLRLPALTPLRLRIEGEVSSKTHKTGDKIVIILAEPLRVSDTLQVAAGTRGVGEVVHSAKAGMGGKPGELLIAARTLDLSSDIKVPLRSFKMAPATGKNQQGLATGLSVAAGAVGGVAAMIMTGGSARISQGSEAIAKTAADIELPAALLQPIPPVDPIFAVAPAAPIVPAAAPVTDKPVQ